tara:strand:+ start:379 stop:1359 length:981 start_codon:yes stop_codon:yes gene_type:complete
MPSLTAIGSEDVGGPGLPPPPQPMPPPTRGPGGGIETLPQAPPELVDEIPLPDGGSLPLSTPRFGGTATGTGPGTGGTFNVDMSGNSDPVSYGTGTSYRDYDPSGGRGPAPEQITETIDNTPQPVGMPEFSGPPTAVPVVSGGGGSAVDSTSSDTGFGFGPDTGTGTSGFTYGTGTSYRDYDPSGGRTGPTPEEVAEVIDNTPPVPVVGGTGDSGPALNQLPEDVQEEILDYSDYGLGTGATYGDYDPSGDRGPDNTTTDGSYTVPPVDPVQNLGLETAGLPPMPVNVRSASSYGLTGVQPIMPVGFNPFRRPEAQGGIGSLAGGR